MERPERIATAIRQSGMTKSAVAHAVGVSPAAVSQWISGGTKDIKNENLFALATITAVSARWLATGEGPMEAGNEVPAAASVRGHQQAGELDGESYVFVDRYDAKLSAGPGNMVWVVREKDPISFRQSWFRKKGLHADNCKALYVRGRSMEPKLEDWDTVVIDTGDTELIDGEIYAVVFKNHFYIKTLERTGEGVRLKSENPEFKHIEVAEAELGQLTVLGRKVWRGG
jgi:phage repressor protein C with HTH and peptisase S24 domain